MSISRRRKKKLPRWCLDKSYKPLQHEVDDYSCWTDRATPTPELDTDSRTAFDALDSDKPRGMGESNTK